MKHPIIKKAALAAILSAGIATVSQAADVLYYSNLNLESNVPGVASRHDSQTENPWGVADIQNILLIANNGSGTVTGYFLNGVPLRVPTGNAGPFTAANPKESELIITVPAVQANGVGTPTGIRLVDVDNNHAFPLNNLKKEGHTTPAELLGVTQDGEIFGYSLVNLQPTKTGNTAQVVKTVPGANYTGLAITYAKNPLSASQSLTRFIYAANTATGAIDVFDNQYNLQTAVSFPFIDPTVANKGVPVNLIHYEIRSKKEYYLIVAYAQLSANGAAAPLADTTGAGYVNLFKSDGTFVSTLVASGGVLNAPYGLTHNGSALWVGDHGDGKIHRYGLSKFDAAGGPTVTPLDNLDDVYGQALQITGLWGIHFAHRPASPLQILEEGVDAFADNTFVGYAAQPFTGGDGLGLVGRLHREERQQ